MPFTLIDLDRHDSDESALYGPFHTHAEAREAARLSQLRAYSIYCDGVRVESIARAAMGWLHEDIAVVVPQDER